MATATSKFQITLRSTRLLIEHIHEAETFLEIKPGKTHVLRLLNYDLLGLGRLPFRS
jgi:hypothetical protein